MKAMWDERYGEDGFAYGTEPNDWLAAQMDQIPPGDVLFLAEGEGRNAVAVAVHRKERGVPGRIVAVDLSETGLEKARALGAERGVEIETVATDLAEFTIGEGCWAGVVSVWGHMPPPVRKKVHAAVVKGLCGGGVMILEAYRPEQLEHGTGGPPVAAAMMSAAGLREELAGLEFEILEEVTRHIAEGKYHHGTSATVQLLARKP